MENNKKDYIRIITFGEFEELIKTRNNLILPANYIELTPNALGIIIDNTFRLIEASEEASQYIEYNRGFFVKKSEEEPSVHYFKGFTHRNQFDEEVVANCIQRLKDNGWVLEHENKKTEMFWKKEGREPVELWWYINNRQITHAIAMDYENDEDGEWFFKDGVTRMFEVMTRRVLNDYEE